MTDAESKETETEAKAEAEAEEKKPVNTFKVEDRVREVEGVRCLGTVKDVREEVTTTASNEAGDLMIKVLWDNGTFSYMSPEAIEVVSA